MHIQEETIIPQNRRKIAFTVIGRLALVGAGAWLVSLDDSRVISERGFRLFLNNPLVAHSLGWLAIAFFGGVALFSIGKLFDTTPGLVFNSEGITDNAGLNAAGFIPWQEVGGYEVFEMSGQKMLVIFVRAPDKYAWRGNFMKRKLNAANAQMVGSPISIPTNTLGVGVPELISLFEEYHCKYGRRPDGE